MESKAGREVVAERHPLRRRVAWNARFLAGRVAIVVRTEGPAGLVRGGGRWVARQRLRLPARARLALAVRRHPGRHSVVFLDIDGLTSVDQELGRPAAEAIVAQLESSLRGALEPSDWHYRHGADELVLVTSGGGETTSERTAGLAADFATRSGSRCSFGIAQHQPGEPALLLLLRAQAAMHSTRDVDAAAGKLTLGLTTRPR